MCPDRRRRSRGREDAWTNGSGRVSASRSPCGVGHLDDTTSSRGDASHDGAPGDGVVPPATAPAAREHGDPREAIGILRRAGERTVTGRRRFVRGSSWRPATRLVSRTSPTPAASGRRGAQDASHRRRCSRHESYGSPRVGQVSVPRRDGLRQRSTCASERYSAPQTGQVSTVGSSSTGVAAAVSRRAVVVASVAAPRPVVLADTRASGDALLVEPERGVDARDGRAAGGLPVQAVAHWSAISSASSSWRTISRTSSRQSSGSGSGRTDRTVASTRLSSASPWR